MKMNIDGKIYESADNTTWAIAIEGPQSLRCDLAYIERLEYDLEEAEDTIESLTKANILLYRAANDPDMQAARAKGYWRRLWLTLLGRLK